MGRVSSLLLLLCAASVALSSHVPSSIKRSSSAARTGSVEIRKRNLHQDHERDDGSVNIEMLNRLAAGAVSYVKFVHNGESLTQSWLV